MSNWIERLPRSIYGIHDRHDGSIWNGHRGWILHVEAIGHNPSDHSGADLYDWSSAGFGVICRIQHEWNPGGCIPIPSLYGDFALRVRNFVSSSSGCHIWIIGNEMNHAIEWPDGQPVYPWDYAVCYDLCREAIHSLLGHEDDWVCIGAVAPWNDSVKYEGNERGDWVQYLSDILDELFALGTTHDAIALHTYTHGPDPYLITTPDPARMDPPFEDRYYNFAAFVDFMKVIDPTVPVFITETNQDGPWLDEQNGWIPAAYDDINTWNQDNPDLAVWALILYRWQGDAYEFYNRGNVIEEFQKVLALNYERPTKEPPTMWTQVYFNDMNAFYDYQSPELTVPVDSVPLWEHDRDNGQLDRPEYDARVPPHTYDDTPSAAGMFSMHTTMEAAIVFEVTVKPGDEVRASVFANGIIDSPNPQMALRLGLATSYPGAGAIEVDSPDGKFTGALESKASWGDWFSTFGEDEWGQLWTPVVEATSNRVWILLNGRKDFAHPGHTHWDRLSVEVRSGSEPPVEPPNPSDLGDQIREVALQLESAASDLRVIASKVDDMESNCSEEAKAEVAEARSLLDEALSKM